MTTIEPSEGVLDQAISWFMTLRAGATDEQWADHLRWLEADPSHAVALAEVEHAWVDADALAAIGQASALPPLRASSRQRRRPL